MLETMPEKLIAYGIEKGKNEGKKEGIEEGIEKERKNVVLKMLKKGLSIEDIANITDFTIDYIEKLRDKSKLS